MVLGKVIVGMRLMQSIGGRGKHPRRIAGLRQVRVNQLKRIAVAPGVVPHVDDQAACAPKLRHPLFNLRNGRGLDHRLKAQIPDVSLQHL
jgi:hypothetical protein